MDWCHSISIRFLVIYQQNTQRCYCFDPGVFSVSTIGTNAAKFSHIWFHPTTLNRDERKRCRGNRTRTSCIALFIMTKPFGCFSPSNWLLLVTDAFINAKNCIFQAQWVFFFIQDECQHLTICPWRLLSRIESQMQSRKYQQTIGFQKNGDQLEIIGDVKLFVF